MLHVDIAPHVLYMPIPTSNPDVLTLDLSATSNPLISLILAPGNNFVQKTSGRSHPESQGYGSVIGLLEAPPGTPISAPGTAVKGIETRRPNSII